MKITVGIGAIRPRTIEAAARSICCQTWRDLELIIVGQGPDPALACAADRLMAADPRIRYIHLDQAGVSRARNTIFRHATGDVIALTDDDCEADPQWLVNLAVHLDADKTIGLVGGALVCPPKPRLKISTCPGMVPQETIYDPAASGCRPPAGFDWVGGSVAMRAEVAARVGPFDESLGAGAAFPAAEDTDYKFRLEALGIRMAATPRAVVRHTYGRRVGLEAVLCASRNYARGNGGLAGKLTLLGDPRGEIWLAAARRKLWHDVLRGRRAPAAVYRWNYFLTAYREVLAGYAIDAATGCLMPKVRSQRWLTEVPGVVR